MQDEFFQPPQGCHSNRMFRCSWQVNALDIKRIIDYRVVGAAGAVINCEGAKDIESVCVDLVY